MPGAVLGVVLAPAAVLGFDLGEVPGVGVLGEVVFGQAAVGVVVAGDRGGQLQQALSGQWWRVVLSPFSS